MPTAAAATRPKKDEKDKRIHHRRHWVPNRDVLHDRRGEARSLVYASQETQQIFSTMGNTSYEQQSVRNTLPGYHMDKILPYRRNWGAAAKQRRQTTFARTCPNIETTNNLLQYGVRSPFGVLHHFKVQQWQHGTRAQHGSIATRRPTCQSQEQDNAY